MGPASSKVTVVEFSDFQCPYCRQLFWSLDSIRHEYPGDVAVVFRNYPIQELHPQARPAAVAAECAGMQGRFEAYHDLLFRLQDSLGHVSWNSLARRSQVPALDQFEACLTDARTAMHIDSDVHSADSLAIRGTPLVFVNEFRFPGTPTYRIIDSIVSIIRAGR